MKKLLSVLAATALCAAIVIPASAATGDVAYNNTQTLSSSTLPAGINSNEAQIIYAVQSLPKLIGKYSLSSAAIQAMTNGFALSSVNVSATQATTVLDDLAALRTTLDATQTLDQLNDNRTKLIDESVAAIKAAGFKVVITEITDPTEFYKGDPDIAVTVNTADGAPVFYVPNLFDFIVNSKVGGSDGAVVYVGPGVTSSSSTAASSSSSAAASSSASTGTTVTTSTPGAATSNPATGDAGTISLGVLATLIVAGGVLVKTRKH